MIGYIILVSMAIALSVMVYYFLVHYLPGGEEVTCPDEVSLSLRDVYCNAAEYNLTFDIKNNGLFSVDGFRVRVNDRDGSNIGIHVLAENYDEFKPGDISSLSIDYLPNVTDGLFQSNLKLLEVQPFYFDEGKFTYCKSVITDLDCSRIDEVCGAGRDYDGDGLYDCDDPDCFFSIYCSRDDVNLVAHYLLDLNADDSSRYNNHGTPHNNPLFSDGYLSDAISLDGSSQYISVSSSDSLNLKPNGIESEKITISAWINPSSLSGIQSILDSSSYSLKLDDNNVIFSVNGGADKVTGDSVSLSSWNFIVARYDGSDLSVSVDNGGFDNEAHSGAIGDANDVYIGRATSSSEFFEGSIDELRIYNYSLSNREVDDLFEHYGGTSGSGTPSTETNCADGIDNDGDGNIDCVSGNEDSDCPCTSTESACSDSVDNDGDSDTDCSDSDCSSDPACSGPSEICDNLVDDNSNLLIDCQDPLCSGDPSCPPSCDNYVYSCANITTVGLHCLMDDLSSNNNDCINITASGVTFDCMDHTITGTGASIENYGGINVRGYGASISGINVKNCEVLSFGSALYVNNVIDSFDDFTNNNLSCNPIDDCYGAWILNVNNSFNGQITHNYFCDNVYGILLENVNYSFSGEGFYSNTICSSSEYGFYDLNGRYNTITGFNFYMNTLENLFFDATTYGNNVHDNWFDDDPSWNIPPASGHNCYENYCGDYGTACDPC